MSTLAVKHCLLCDETIFVATYQPHPRRSEATGVPVLDTKKRFIGWSCLACAAVASLNGRGHGTLDRFKQMELVDFSFETHKETA